MKLSANLDKIGLIGLFITALTSPCCFPLFGFILTAFGLGSFELFGEQTMWIFQGLVLLSLVGTYISYRQHRQYLPLFTAVASTLLIFFAYHFYNADNWTTLIYTGMFGLLLSSGHNYLIHRRHKISCATCVVIDGKEYELNSKITCPKCGYQKDETMPTDACQFFYQCEQCQTVLRPLKGDCCVYCSYGTVACPSKQ
jgi:predicted ferric reductase